MTLLLGSNEKQGVFTRETAYVEREIERKLSKNCQYFYIHDTYMRVVYANYSINKVE